MIANYFVVWLVSSNCRLLPMLNTASAELFAHQLLSTFEHMQFSYFGSSIYKQFSACFFFSGKEKDWSGCVFVFVYAQCAILLWLRSKQWWYFDAANYEGRFMHFTHIQLFNTFFYSLFPQIFCCLYKIQFTVCLFRCLFC